MRGSLKAGADRPTARLRGALRRVYASMDLDRAGWTSTPPTSASEPGHERDGDLLLREFGRLGRSRAIKIMAALR
jgi:hypothetical protein